jgi:hypothetical protein
MNIRIDDISKSYNCPLASKVRKKIHKFGYYDGFAVVYSPEEVSSDVVMLEAGTNKKSAVGTISYMPPIFGCMIASVVIRKLIGKEIYPEVKDKRYYANKKDPKTGFSYNIPMLRFDDPEYINKYIEYMKMKEEKPEQFQKILNWD